MAENINVTEPSDEFRCWWSPSRWLSIVYGIWFDQRRYWQAIRPRLQKYWWLVVLQGLLGSLLMCLGLMAVLDLLILLVGRQIDWQMILGMTLLAAGYGLMVSVAIGNINFNDIGRKTSRSVPWEERAAHFLPIAVTMTVVSGFTPLIYALSGLEGGWTYPWDGLTFLAVLLMIVGLAIGVGLTVSFGAFPRILYAALGAAGVLAGGVMMANPSKVYRSPLVTLGLTVFICGFLAFVWFLAERWVIRQVPNVAERKSLVNNEKGK